MMYRQVRSIENKGVSMLHTSRSFGFYRRVFYQGMPEEALLASLKNRRVVDVGCGYTPYAQDSMFQACHRAEIEFYGVDPVLKTTPSFGFKERALAKLVGSSGRFNTNAAGLKKALPATAQSLPFDDQSVDEVLCSYLLFVWIEDERLLADIFNEFDRVPKPDGVLKLYPLFKWNQAGFTEPAFLDVLGKYFVKQQFVHNGLDFRVLPSFLTSFSKNGER